MYLRDRPLLPNGLDKHLYVDRPQLEEEVLAPLRQSRNVLLIGEAGSGKTTLMRFIAEKLAGEQRVVSWVNAAPAQKTEDLLTLIEAELDSDPDQPVGTPESLQGVSRLLSHARLLHRFEPQVICLDGLSDAGAGFDLFGRLRDELWAAGHTWLVGVRPQDAVSIRTPPADAFWGSVVEIPPLSESELQQLLRRGLDDTEWASVGWPADSSMGEYPREVIRQAQAVLNGSANAERIDRHRLQLEADNLGRSEGMVMAELLDLNRPASAHDPELETRLGWSQPYIQRILASLERKGLLRALNERNQRQGRPRKMYEPKARAT